MKKIILTVSTVFVSIIITNIASAGSYGNNAKECPILYELGSWEHKNTKDGEEYWGRSQHWFGDDGLIIVTGNTIDLEKKYNSNYIENNTQNPVVIVYIGPWEKITLNKGSFWNREKQEVEIRMIASQRNKILENHYEIKDKLNAKIPEQKFIPLEEPEDLVIKCDILRAEKFGYNAVADYYINIFQTFFGKPILAGTGKIINSETSEIIADESGDIVKEKDK